MKEFFKKFALRGLMFAWGGPAVMVIVWFFLHRAGEVTTLEVNEVVLGTFSMIVMAFIAAGASIVYEIEKLPKATAALIHMSILYVDYLGFYLLNGWILIQYVWVFTVIFLAGFWIIWLSIYIPIKVKVSRINKKLEK